MQIKKTANDHIQVNDYQALTITRLDKQLSTFPVQSTVFIIIIIILSNQYKHIHSKLETNKSISNSMKRDTTIDKIPQNPITRN